MTERSEKVRDKLFVPKIVDRTLTRTWGGVEGWVTSTIRQYRHSTINGCKHDLSPDLLTEVTDRRTGKLHSK